MLIDYNKRVVEIWNICLDPKQRKSVAFPKVGYKNYVSKNAYPCFKNQLYVADTKGSRKAC